jgi:O-antigen/teichoic acid export membrane protein
VISTVGWCLFTVQDSVLTALGRAVLVPVENGAFSLAKLALLAVAVGALPVYGIFVSWTAGMLASVVVVNGFIFTRLARGVPARAGSPPLALRDSGFRRYFAADYACSVAWVSATALMPVVITAVAGATTIAYYALAYSVALPLYALVMATTTALVVHGTREPAELPALVRKAARQGAIVVLPIVAFILVLAPQVLAFFGEQYADRSASVLRLLAAGVVPYLVINISVSVARVRRRLRRAVVALVSQAALALGLVVPFLNLMGVTGAGVAWLLSLTVVALGLGVAEARASVRERR